MYAQALTLSPEISEDPETRWILHLTGRSYLNRTVGLFPYGSKYTNKEYLAKTTITAPYVETQSLYCIGTWALTNPKLGFVEPPRILGAYGGLATLQAGIWQRLCVPKAPVAEHGVTSVQYHIYEILKR